MLWEANSFVGMVASTNHASAEETISPLGFVRREFTNIFLMALLEELLK